MSSASNTGWLTYSLLQLSPPAFFHCIWINFINANTPHSPHLIERLHQAAEQLVINNDLENACQIWLICAVLESKLGNINTALEFTEKTAEFAQNNHLPRIHEWASWGASSLCARQGNWQQAIYYLRRLQQVLNNQGDWVLANVINVLETSLDQLDTKKQASLTHSTTDSQLDIILEQFLHWEVPNLTSTMSQTSSDDHHSFFRRLWNTLATLFTGKTRSKLPTTKLPNPKSFPLPQITEVDMPSVEEVPDKASELEAMNQLLDGNISRPQAKKERLPTPSRETKKRTEDEPYIKIKNVVPSLNVYCLGSFRAYQDEKPIEHWPSGKGKLIFKYLLVNRQQPIAKEVLMEQFWPDANPDAARNNLNVAIYGLRQALRDGGYEDFSHLLFQEDNYLLNPKLQMWIDFELFLDLWQTGSKQAELGNWEEAVQDYHAAVALYQGELFAEDRYEEWLIPQRQYLEDTYLSLLEQLSQYYFQNEGYVSCIEACRNILGIDSCREGAHRRLMRCYCRQGHYYLGIRQYHQCVEALHNELDVKPSPKTIELYQQVRRHEPI